MIKENSTVSKMETTTLTEKWKNGELKEGFYYLSIVPSKKCIDYYYGEDFERYNEWAITKVLAPVPTYDEWVKEGIWFTEKSHNELLKKVEELEKQLKEANNLLLGFLDENICSFDHNGYCQEHSSTEPDYRCIQQQLKWYFKKYEVKNDKKF